MAEKKSTTPSHKVLPDKTPPNAYGFWAPRCWHGMLFSDWIRLLVRGRFAIRPAAWGLTFAVSCVTVFNSVMRLLQESFYGRRLDQTEIKQAPVFIIGHWRSGTTMLHEMFVQDERFSYPDTYQCFLPNHFVLTRPFLAGLVNALLPAQRPMDNMPMGNRRPQEDEFALMCLGQLSPYLSLAFPRRPWQGVESLDCEAMDVQDLQRWKQALLWFMKRVTYCNPKRLVLKSPPHTGRIKALLEMFPDARFVHIVRDPFVVYASSMRLWRSLSRVQSLQLASDERWEEFVFDCFERMYGAFERQQPAVDSAQFYEVRYEDLVSDPLGQMRAIYEHLDLGDFEPARPRLEKYLAGVADYQPNRYELPPEVRARIVQRWGRFIEKYGYDT